MCQSGWACGSLGLSCAGTITGPKVSSHILHSTEHGLDSSCPSGHYRVDRDSGEPEKGEGKESFPNTADFFKHQSCSFL